MSDTWQTDPPEWTTEDYDELVDGMTVMTPVKKLLENSENFPIKFPIDSVRCKTLITGTPQHISEEKIKHILEENINSAYPVVHEKVLKLYLQFLGHKRNYGTDVEKALYQDMTVTGLVDRLLTKRAVMFVGRHDKYMLLNGEGGVGRWETIGTPDEEEPLILEKCLSYDEIKLSALLSVSSYTQFINIGDRNNCGEIESNINKIEQNGVIIGLIGARLEKPNVMEYQELIISKEQNVLGKGYGDVSPPTTKQLFFNFYREPCLTYEQLTKLDKKEPFIEIRSGSFFNNSLYEKRLALSIDTLLIDANARAKVSRKMAYLHVVGIGLGVWRISSHQDAIFMKTFEKRIKFLSSTLLHINDICFSYINHRACGEYANGDILPIEGHENKGIQIHIFDRQPHEKLKNTCKSNLLVVSYAWDGNALPGNEFWLGQLAASGDPAAASSTQISELHNPHINPRVSSEYLRIATTTGLLTLEEYRQKMRESLNNEPSGCKL